MFKLQTLVEGMRIAHKTRLMGNDEAFRHGLAQYIRSTEDNYTMA